MKSFLLHVLLPIVLLVGAGGLAWWLVKHRTVVVAAPPTPEPPLVTVVVATMSELRLLVTSQGTAAPRTATTLSAEVAGRVVYVASSLRNGGFFAANDELVRIEPIEHETALRRAEAEAARAARVLTWERAEAEAAVAEWRLLNSNEPPVLVARGPQLAEAEAVQRSALAAVAQAKHDIDRTTVRAPYAGRVLLARVDTGDFVTRGTVLARVHALDAVEIALPLPDAELRHVALPQTPGAGPGPAVRFFAEFGGKASEWHGRIVRTAGEIDAKTRMVQGIAEVESPFTGATPLMPGMFVQAEIEGHVHQNVIVLPRTAMRDGHRVFVVDASGVMRLREVDVLRAERDRIVLRSGVAAGELICTQNLEAPTDGMRVRVAAAEGGR